MGSNQYTLAKEQGIEPGDEGWPKQAETRREHPEEVRAAIRASVAVHFLQGLLNDPNAEIGHKVNASKILLDKTIASLSAVDQTVHDADQNNPEQTEAKLRMLINKAEPALLSRILGERARSLRLDIEPEVGNDEDQVA